MNWLETYHDDHLYVLQLLAKLEGNLLEVKQTGTVRDGIQLEFREVIEVFTEVIRPHFAREEEYIYPRLAKADPPAREFTAAMLKEHQEIYIAFNHFTSAIRQGQAPAILTAGADIVRLLRLHIEKEETELPALVAKIRFD